MKIEHTSEILTLSAQTPEEVVALATLARKFARKPPALPPYLQETLQMARATDSISAGELARSADIELNTASTRSSTRGRRRHFRG